MGTVETREKTAYREKALCMSSFCFLFPWQGVPVNFSVLEIINTVVFVNLSNHSAGIANCYHVGWQIFRDNTACTNDDLVANGNARQNNCTCSNPAIFPDVNRHIILIDSFSEFRKNWMSSRCNNHTRCKHRVIANINMSVIDHC